NPQRVGWVGPDISASTPLRRATQFERAINHARRRFSELMASQSFIRPWKSPSAPEEVARHFQSLNIPTVNGAPSLLCHGLGETSSFDFDKPDLHEARLNTVFLVPQSNDSVEHS
ncbi:hypothetical protein H0H93_013724, partial [Arthromyces matolae]